MRGIIIGAWMLATLGAATAQAQTARPDTIARAGYSVADVRFLQHMLGHHAQALRMTALVPARTVRPEMRLLAERIEQSQTAEIAQMTRWLARRGEMVPAVGAAGRHGPEMARMDSTHLMAGMTMHRDSMPTMPGMLTEAQLAELAAATGAVFERLFLGDMIRHHEGALTMVAELLAMPGAAQEPEIDRISSDVDADQRAEIARMRALLAAMPGPTATK